MNAAPPSRCPRCGAALLVNESSCPGCLLEVNSTGQAAFAEDRIFREALALEPPARAGFIQEATAGDPQLCAAVLALLAGYEEAGGDAARPTLGEAPNHRAQWAAVGNEEPGTMIHHFRLIGKLGEGGMGSVWRAEQTEPVRRTVALKIIKLGMDTREVVRRFERERQTLALLNHSNIARVFEAGATALGRPYFVMELVEGEPITSYCRRAGLDLAARLRLFLEVCAAVEHAHQKGVIHRDLKPTNILVAAGMAKVIDFGVAKATQDAGDLFLTQQARVVGTPAYMSPEQAQTGGVDVDTRTDVYALGVVLYELLTDTLPIEPARLMNLSVPEIQRVILEHDPPTPGTRLKSLARQGRLPVLANLPKTSLPRDLDRVVMKALRKDRNDRYASAAALAEDLRRYLAGEPVSAMPPSPAYAAGKFLRRHRVAVAAVTAIFLVLMAGAIVSARMAVSARRAAALEKIARQQSMTTLSRMFTQFALRNGHAGNPAEAAFWAVKAAEANADNPAEYEAGLKRAEFWTDEAPVPWRAFQSDFNEIRKLVFHPSERYLIAERRDGLRQVWDVDHEAGMSLAGTNCFAAATWTRDGNLLAVVRPGGNEIALCQFPSGAVWQTPLAGGTNANAINCLAFNCTGNLLAAGAGCSVAIFWRTNAGSFDYLMSIPQKGSVARIVFNPANPGCLAVAMTNNDAGLFFIDPMKLACTAAFTEENHLLLSRRIDSAEPPYFDRTGRTVMLARQMGRSGFGFARCDSVTGAALDKDMPMPGFVLATSPDGSLALCRNAGVAGGADEEDPSHSASLADTRNGNGRTSIHFKRIVTVADFSADGQRAVVGSEDGQVTVLAAPDWRPEFQLSRHESQVMGVAFSPGGRFVATAQAGGLIRVWRIERPDRFLVPLGHDSRVAVSRDGNFFALAGRSAAAATLPYSRVYNVSDGLPAGPKLEGSPGLTGGGEAGPLMDADFSPDGNVLVTANTEPGFSRQSFVTNAGSITFWNWRNGERLGEPIRTPSEPRSVAWRPDGRQVAACCAAGQFLAIDPATRKVTELARQKVSWPARFPVNNGEIAYDPASGTLVAWGLQRQLHLWSLATGQQHIVQTHSLCADVALAAGGVLAWAQTGTREGNPKVFVLNSVTGDPLVAPLDQPEWMNSVAFDPAGRLLLTTDNDGVARIWDWRARKISCPLMRNSGPVFAARFVPGTPYVVTGADHGMFTIIDSRTGIEIASFAGGPADSRILEIAVTPNGRTAIFDGSGLGGVGLARLDGLHDPSPLDLKGWLELASLNASATADEAGGLVPISSGKEWLSRWRDFRRENPDYHRF